MADIMSASSESPVELVTVDRPEADATLTVPTGAGLQIVLAFNPDDATFGIEGDDFILSFEDGAEVVFQGLVTAAEGAHAPTIQIAGIDIDAGVLMDQVLALAEQVQVEPIETAAGEEGEDVEAADGGSSRYDDSFGDLIAGLIEQGVIGETELLFGLIAGGNIELPVDTAALSGGHAGTAGGFDPLDAENPGSDDDPAPDAPSVSDSDDDDSQYSGGDPESLTVSAIDILTNEATGNLEIPDELLLYLATSDRGEGLSVTGPSNGDGYNAEVWEVDVDGLGGTAPDNPNTWANHVNDNVKFHIGNGNPYYEGRFTYEVTDEMGATGMNTIGVRSVETENVRSYWTLNGTDLDEVLLGQDGRNIIDGGGGKDFIHGGHDNSGDILIGGAGDDVIFGGGGKDTFIMLAGFDHDKIDGGEGGGDTIALDGVLTQDDLDDLSSWLTLNPGHTITGIVNGVISLSADASGTINLGDGNVIDFLNIEQIDYANVA